MVRHLTYACAIILAAGALWTSPARAQSGISSNDPINSGTTPVLTLITSTVLPGGSAQVRLTNGSTGAQDWIGLFAIGAPNSSILAWSYTGGRADFSWTTAAPSTVGQYEFRYFRDNSYQMAMNSSVLTVSTQISDPAANEPVLTLTASTVLPGGDAVVTLTRGYTGAQD
ncbi:MAG TPA: hypothetical protein VFV50_10320, partial [Bdellovibrionales bacterium]|nr:hypothetical protein [Bdellovibrionales bacterium]